MHLTEITTFQMAVLFAWNQRPKEQISFENLRLATGNFLTCGCISLTLEYREDLADSVTIGNHQICAFLAELPDSELRRTLWSLCQFPKLKRQVLICEPEASNPREFNEASLFSVNQDFALVKNNKVQRSATF